MNAAYDARFPSTDRALQAACADGTTPITRCPGNRRWIQLVFDSFLLMADGAVSMVDARDAMLAADRLRFRGANQAVLWDAFARRGLGEEARSVGVADPDPRPGFSSPLGDEGRVRVAATDSAGRPVPAQLFVGRFEARSVPVADADPATPLADTVALVPGRYELLLRAPGHGTQRTTVDVRAGQDRVLAPALPRNLASGALGATVTGDGANLDRLVDETEGTQWAALGAPARARQVTVRLDPSRRAVQVRRVQVSALLRPTDAKDTGDPGPQSRYSALRAFEVLTCDASTGADCTRDASFRSLLRSPGDAFPADRPRPTAPDLAMRSFAVPNTRATHVRLRIVDNQCTGGPAYQGEQDADPRAETDCSAGSTQDDNVRAAELQVFNR